MQAGDLSRGGSLQALCDSWHTMPAAVRGYCCHDPAVCANAGGSRRPRPGRKTILRALNRAGTRSWSVFMATCKVTMCDASCPRQRAGWRIIRGRTVVPVPGRLAARDKLWGKSRDYFEKATACSAAPRPARNWAGCSAAWVRRMWQRPIFARDCCCRSTTCPNYPGLTRL